MFFWFSCSAWQLEEWRNLNTCTKFYTWHVLPSAPVSRFVGGVSWVSLRPKYLCPQPPALPGAAPRLPGGSQVSFTHLVLYSKMITSQVKQFLHLPLDCNAKRLKLKSQHRIQFPVLDFWKNNWLLLTFFRYPVPQADQYLEEPPRYQKKYQEEDPDYDESTNTIPGMLTLKRERKTFLFHPRIINPS